MTDKVVGIAYEMGDSAPIVVVKGAGEQAQAVLAKAAELGDVPVIRDRELVDALYRVNVDSPIGRDLFPVMAALIAHVMKIDNKQEKQAP
ncbi:MAG TPA: EscU/YscU/HrcU family type III secretion system export apparatus switch protein [Steroidobacteraceae bacterium]|nr:EscU/YscU/HrcU family type III secretion system export apparatus switch protein [Steroidobacteraceae bacterium]